MSQPRICFIVPVRNDAARLDMCLESIRRNLGPGSYHETVVIDHGSTDGSPAVATRHGATVLSVTDRVRVAELRNRGAQLARADILAFVDADHEIGPGWTIATLETMRDPGIVAVGALCLAPLDGTWVQRAYGAMRGRAHGIHDVEWLGSGNLAVRRDAFNAVGGFDTLLETCEDVDLCQRIRSRGGRIVSDARLRNIHYGDPETLKDLFQGERWRGRDNVKVTLRGPLSPAALPSALVPVVDVAMLFTVLVGFVTLPWAFWSGLTAMLLATGVFAAGTLLRVTRAMARDRTLRGWRAFQVLAVAAVYDLGRALALVTPAPHRTETTSLPQGPRGTGLRSAAS